MSPEVRAHEPRILDVALEHRLPCRPRPLDLQPAAVADVVHRLAHGREVDAALSEQGAVLLGVELADPLRARTGGSRRRCRSPSASSSQRRNRPARCGEPTASRMRTWSAALSHDSMPRTTLLSFGLLRDALQPADDFSLSVGVVAKIPRSKNASRTTRTPARGRHRCCR